MKNLIFSAFIALVFGFALYSLVNKYNSDKLERTTLKVLNLETNEVIVIYTDNSYLYSSGETVLIRDAFQGVKAQPFHETSGIGINSVLENWTFKAIVIK